VARLAQAAPTQQGTRAEHWVAGGVSSGLGFKSPAGIAHTRRQGGMGGLFETVLRGRPETGATHQHPPGDRKAGGVSCQKALAL